MPRGGDPQVEMNIGVISDTHGLLRPEAELRLNGVAHIIHAGDIGKPDVIDRLPDRAGDRDPGQCRYSTLGGRLS
jgi:predicted phosphodiesterase